MSGRIRMLDEDLQQLSQATHPVCQDICAFHHLLPSDRPITAQYHDQLSQVSGLVQNCVLKSSSASQYSACMLCIITDSLRLLKLQGCTIGT